MADFSDVSISDFSDVSISDFSDVSIGCFSDVSICDFNDVSICDFSDVSISDFSDVSIRNSLKPHNPSNETNEKLKFAISLLCSLLQYIDVNNHTLYNNVFKIQSLLFFFGMQF